MAIEDAKELKEIISIFSTEVPKLLTAISESLFNPEATGQYAKAVADFYKNLRESGMEDEHAYELTKEFMDKTNFAAMIQEIIGRKGFTVGKKSGRHVASEVEEAVKERIKEKLREKGIESGEE